MRFNSLAYLGFLVAVVALLWLLHRPTRKGWLLVASYVFYASWHWPYLALLVGAAFLNHAGARWMAAAEDRRLRGGVVVAANLLLLGVFKYLDWLTVNANSLLGLLEVPVRLPLAELVLPLGISFYLFQAISYVVDLMRKREGLHSFWDFQLYLAFFPQLIAGPILRAREFLPQLEGRWAVDACDLREGIRSIIVGLFVKIVLADGLAGSVDRAFSLKPAGLGAVDVWVMAAAFGLQVYFDFSAYSRIAIGSARLCGLRLVENFNYPYSAGSPADFWARWHMSLSRWIRDYLFYPLASRSPGLAGMCWAALVAMTLCGLWHGAGWTFVLWGLYHGVLIAGYHVAGSLSRRWGGREARPAPGLVHRTLGVWTTFALVTLGWLFFRSFDAEQAFSLLGRAVAVWEPGPRALPGTFYLHTFLLTVGVWSMPWVERQLVALRALASQRPALHLSLACGEGLVLGVFSVLSLIYLEGQTAFIYFQF